MNGSGGATRRLFVAVPLPADVMAFALGAQGLLPRSLGIRLLRPEQLHVTLAFIGEADERMTEAARAVVESVPVASWGEALIDGFQLLPAARKVRVISLGIADGSGVFSRLFGVVMGGLEAAGVMQREKRPFRAHVTVARVKSPGPVQPMSDCGQAPFTVESVCLYESELRRDGAKYTVLARTALIGANEQDKA